MNTLQAEHSGRAIAALRPRQIGALPLVYPILTDLQVRAQTNALVASQADIAPGRIVVLLTLNRLLAPQPLYHVADWLADTLLPEVLGLGVAPVYDNRLGRTLDRLHSHLGELWAGLVSRAVQVYDLDLSVLHGDLTSVYLEGAYAESALAAYGYSRDQRPDTKQVNLEVAKRVTHDGAVPVLYQALPGNLIEQSCAHAARFAAGLNAAGYEVLNEVALNQVLVSFGDDEATRRVMAAIQQDGTCWCGGAVWQSRAAMRISVSSWATTEADCERSLAVILRIANEQTRH